MRRHHEAFRKVRAVAITLTVTLLVADCGRKQYLAQYQFSDRTLAMVYLEPPSPELLTGFYDVPRSADPVQVAMRVGGGVAKEIQVSRASARLDSAGRHVDVAAQLAQRTLDRASRFLGTRPTTSAADAHYILESTMKRFGIDARYSTATYLYTRAEAVLMDRKTGREIWIVDVRGNDRLTPWVRGNRDVPSSIISAATISTVSVADLREALDQLVTSSSNAITKELRDKQGY